MSQAIRVRFAPSPTGYLHVGGARTALYNFLFAKQNKGTFVLRVEDTDQERSTNESLRMQLADLKWLGLDWDEGIDPESLESKGHFGPYRQSERLDIYESYAEQLLENGQAYYDFRTDEELEAIKSSGGEGGFVRIPRPDPVVSLDEARARLGRGEKAAIRFKVDGGRDHKITDLVRGEVSFPEDMVGDFILMRSSGMPVYNFCCAIDDALMEISHVFRAEEHLSNTLRQKMIFEALGLKSPQYGHLSLILGQDKQKLSKRHGATSCHQYREMGYLPQALLNFVALLGWSPGGDQEILTQEELLQKFSVERLQKAGAVFDEEKFKWMNASHLRALPDLELWAELAPHLKRENIHIPIDEPFIRKSLEAFRPKMETLLDGVELYRPLDPQSFAVSEESKEVLSWETTSKALLEWQGFLQNHGETPLGAADFDQALEAIKDKASVKGKQLFMPLRVAIIGKPQGPDLKTLLPLLSISELKRRTDLVLKACR